MHAHVCVASHQLIIRPNLYRKQEEKNCIPPLWLHPKSHNSHRENSIAQIMIPVLDILNKQADTMMDTVSGTHAGHPKTRKHCVSI